MNSTAVDLLEEGSRLRELWSYDILDTAPDRELDELVKLAADICRAPVAAVSLVDSDRLWFKSRIGVEITEVNRDSAFCDTVVTSKAVLNVDNAPNDPRFSGSTLVCGPAHVRAYLGYPLLAPSNAVLGSFCVIDTQARKWRSTDCDALRILAAQIINRFELHRANAELARLWEDHRALETRALTASRDDQRHLAAELHDGLGQDLTGLSLLIKAARVQTAEASMASELVKIEKIMRSAIDSCRKLARRHLGFSFIHGSLRESLDQYLASVNATSNVHCELEWSKTVALRDRLVAYNLYRIAQDAVMNALRHSGADQIKVTVEERDGKVCMQVDDNGHGRLPTDAFDRGVGLETMNFRAAAIGGTLSIEHPFQRGVSIRCELQSPSTRPRRG